MKKFTRKEYSHKYVNPDVLHKRLRFLEDLLEDRKKVYLAPIEQEIRNVKWKLSQRKPFEPGDILTDGEMLIKIGGVMEPNWTRSNNYGRKGYEYTNCSYYMPKGCETWPITNSMGGNIPESWFDDNGHLGNFRVIDKQFIAKEILDKFVFDKK